jgi:hypothetical protein
MLATTRTNVTAAHTTGANKCYVVLVVYCLYVQSTNSSSCALLSLQGRITIPSVHVTQSCRKNIEAAVGTMNVVSSYIAVLVACTAVYYAYAVMYCTYVDNNNVNTVVCQM